MLNAGVGITTERDSYRAGKKVAREALEQMNTTPKLAILAVDSITRRSFNYAEVLRGVREELGSGVTLIGSTANGIIVNDRFALRSVGLMLIGGDFSVDTSYMYPKSRLEYENIAENIYQKCRGLEPNDNRFMLMFQDGIKFPPEILARQNSLNSRIASLMAGLIKRLFKRQLEEFKERGMGVPSVQELVEELYAKGFNMPVFGNVASDLLKYESVEFFNDEVCIDSVVGAVLSGQGSTKFGFGFAAGAESTGLSCSPTKNIGNFLLKIDGKPALKGFCNAAGIQKESLRELKSSGYINHHTILGTIEKKGDKEYIHLTATITNPELENLVFTGFPFDRVPKKIDIFQSNMGILHKTAKHAVNQALENISNPNFLLGIDCALRFLAYGDNLPNIIKTIDDTIGKDIPRMIIGSGGEIFGNADVDYYFNNMTLITLAGGE